MGGLQIGGEKKLSSSKRENQWQGRHCLPEADLVACLGSEFYVCFVRVIAGQLRSMKKPILRDISVKK